CIRTPSRIHRRCGGQFPFEKDLFPTILELDHVAVLVCKVISLRHRSRFRRGGSGMRTPADGIADLESWPLPGHTPPPENRYCKEDVKWGDFRLRVERF